MTPKKKTISYKTATLNFAKEHDKTSDGYWQHNHCSDETRINEFGSDGVQHVQCGLVQDYRSVGTVKHGGGSVTLRGDMTAKGEMTFIDGSMNELKDESKSQGAWQERIFPT